MVRSVQKAFIAAVLAAFACLLVSIPPTYAAGGLTLSPPLKDIILSPGLLETSADILLTNNTSQQVKAQLKLVDLRSLGDFGGNSLDKAGLPDEYNLANWMTLPSGSEVTIPANQTVVAKVTITNRSDLTPGGHYGAVIVTTGSGTAPKSNVSISQQVVSLIFVKKLGGEQYGLDLKKMLVDQDKGDLPRSVSLNFASTGNVHVIPRGYIEVTDPKGKLVAKGIINPDSLLVLPGATRQLMTSLQPVANSSVSGQYKITAHYRYDGTDEFQTQSLYFSRSGIPRTLILSILGVTLAIFIAAVTYALKKKIHKFKK
jgi:hypothetical protein